jgi:hypothetical protein
VPPSPPGAWWPYWCRAAAGFAPGFPGRSCSWR